MMIYLQLTSFHISFITQTHFFISQGNYIKKVLENFGMSHTNADITSSEKYETNGQTLDVKVF